MNEFPRTDDGSPIEDVTYYKAEGNITRTTQLILLEKEGVFFEYDSKDRAFAYGLITGPNKLRINGVLKIDAPTS